MKVIKNLFYTKDHDWVKVEGNKAYIGITDYAQHALGDIVFVELPEIETELAAGDTYGVVESVKAASDLMIHVDGLRERLGYATKNVVGQKEQSFSQLVAQLELLSPLAVLAKGYSVVRKKQNSAAIRSAGQLKEGDLVEMIFSKGKAEAKVLKKFAE